MQLVYNWHITERCNYTCHFCFSKWEHPSEIWKEGTTVESILREMAISQDEGYLKPIKEACDTLPSRVNFVGGEPLILGNTLIRYIKFAKEIGLDTSIITNASLLRKYVDVVRHLDIIGISIDSLSHETNLRIGRSNKHGKTISEDSLIALISDLRKINSSVQLKFNVVVNEHNYKEILIPKLNQHEPDKIKIFRQLPFGRQKGISDIQFSGFLAHNGVDTRSMFVEDNHDMVKSYLMIDPQGRFFQNGEISGYSYSEPIQEVGLKNAFKGMEFDSTKYLKRYKMGA